MSDSKDDGSSDVSREKIEGAIKKEEGAPGEGLDAGGGAGVAGCAPPAPADFNYWARQDLWHTIEHGPMLIKGWEPVDVQAY